MENHPDFHGYDHPNDHNQLESVSMFDCWNSDEGFHHGLASLNGDHSQPTPAFEPRDDSAQSSSTTDFASPQQSQTFGDGGSYYPVWTAAPQEGAETPNWLSASEIIAVHTNNGVGRVQPLAVTASIPPYNVLPLSASSPSSITFQPMGSEHVGPPFYVSQQGFELPPAGEVGENPFYHSSLNSGEIPPQQTSRNRPSRSRAHSNLPVLKYYCNIRPCSYQKAFARKADMQRHQATQHPQHYQKKLSQCPWPGCERKGANGFPRRDKMQRHQDRVHGQRMR